MTLDELARGWYLNQLFMINDADFQPDLEVGAEDESDIRQLQKADISSVSVTGTDWTTETVLSQLKKGNIELNPRFQRRDAWEPLRKSRFIESLILGLPVPPIVLAERKDARGKYIVLDGKQRLLCLRQFTAEPIDPEFRSFKLTDLQIRPDLNGCTYADLAESLHLRGEMTAFENQSIRTVVVRNWRTEALLFHIFIRLNSGSKPLSPQELRQALHPGKFLDFADESATASHAIREILNLKEPDFRMRDVELIIRYFSFRRRLASYKGNLKEFLDDSCKEFNQQWGALAGAFAVELAELEVGHQAVRAAFGPEFNYGKWLGGKYERRFNRAVFDVVIAVFLSSTLRPFIDASPQECVVAFKKICVEDARFVESIERTTKSLEATRYRFTAMFSSVALAYGTQVDIPTIGD